MSFRLTPRSMTLDDLELYKFEFSENFSGFRRFRTQQQLNEWRYTSIVSDNVKHVELEQFLACFRVARVCQRQLGFLVIFLFILLFRNDMLTSWNYIASSLRREAALPCKLWQLWHLGNTNEVSRITAGIVHCTGHFHRLRSANLSAPICMKFDKWKVESLSYKNTNQWFFVISFCIAAWILLRAQWVAVLEHVVYVDAAIYHTTCSIFFKSISRLWRLV